MKMTVVMVLFVGVLTYFFGLQDKGFKLKRGVAAAPVILSPEVFDAFQNYCVTCHTQFENEQAILNNKRNIYNRIVWLKETPDTPPKIAMPRGAARMEFKDIDPVVYEAMLNAMSVPDSRPQQNPNVAKLIVPEGFTVELLATVPGARSIVLGDEGMIFIGTGGFANPLERIYVIWDKNKNDQIEKTEIRIIADNLQNPNGVAFRKGTLFVAEEHQIVRYDNITQWVKSTDSTILLTSAQSKIVTDDFPKEGGHSWKYIRFGKAPNDNQLYFTVGAPCNVCLSAGSAAIYRVNVDNGQQEMYAEGVRNSVGFDFHPQNGQLWFTDNGRDSLGDNFPPDELNVATAKGQHFGFPHCHGMQDPAGRDKDPQFNRGEDCKKYQQPAQALAAHAAALGLRFYTGTQFPSQYRNQIFIAEHGSWNRSTYSGHRVSLVTKDATGKMTYTPFIEGWVQPGNTRWGRPVDVEVLSNGDMLVSDDGVPGSANSGSLYRIRYSK